jgi:hypothetical protein
MKLACGPIRAETNEGSFRSRKVGTQDKGRSFPLFSPCYSTKRARKGDFSVPASIHRFLLLSGVLVGVGEGGERIDQGLCNLGLGLGSLGFK